MSEQGAQTVEQLAAEVAALRVRLQQAEEELGREREATRRALAIADRATAALDKLEARRAADAQRQAKRRAAVKASTPAASADNHVTVRGLSRDTPAPSSPSLALPPVPPSPLPTPNTPPPLNPPPTPFPATPTPSSPSGLSGAADAGRAGALVLQVQDARTAKAREPSSQERFKAAALELRAHLRPGLLPDPCATWSVQRTNKAFGPVVEALGVAGALDAFRRFLGVERMATQKPGWPLWIFAQDWPSYAAPGQTAVATSGAGLKRLAADEDPWGDA